MKLKGISKHIQEHKILGVDKKIRQAMFKSDGGGGGGAVAETDPIFNAWLIATPPIFTEVDPVFTAWDKDYADLINQPSIPTGTTAGQITFILPSVVASKAWARIPQSGTITGSYITGDISGSAVIDLWVDTFANFPPTVADTITAAAKPTLSSAQTASDTTLTGWTTALTAGKWIMANVDSASTLNQIVLVITYTKT